MAATAAQRWLVEQLEQRGWAGLESVADYLMTVSSEEDCASYLASLLGPDAQAAHLAKSFCTRRNDDAHKTMATPHPSATTAATAAKAPAAATAASTEKATVDSLARSPNPKQRNHNSSAKGGAANPKQRSHNSSAQSGTANPKKKLPLQRVRDARAANEIVNCLRCGRIHRSFNDAGHCDFCGVYLWVDYFTTTTPASPAPANAAQRQLDTLLEYDRTAAKRTVVLDDDADYFDTTGDRWLSDAEKAQREAQRPVYNSRSQVRLNLDVRGGKASAEVLPRGAPRSGYAHPADSENHYETDEMANQPLRNPGIGHLVRPVFIPSGALASLVASGGSRNSSDRVLGDHSQGMQSAVASTPPRS